MYRRFLFCLTLMLICGLNLGNAAVEIGFLYLGDNGPFTKPALEFAKDTFSTTELGKGDIKSDKFKKFAVVWWNEGDTDPGALSAAEIDAFLDYAESGGAILLTGGAVRYVTTMGLEDAQPRQFAPVLDDNSNVGIIVLQKTLDLGLIEGLQNVDGDRHHKWMIGSRSIRLGIQELLTISINWLRILLHLPMHGRVEQIMRIGLGHSVIGKQGTAKCLI